MTNSAVRPQEVPRGLVRGPHLSALAFATRPATVHRRSIGTTVMCAVVADAIDVSYDARIRTLHYETIRADRTLSEVIRPSSIDDDELVADVGVSYETIDVAGGWATELLGRAGERDLFRARERLRGVTTLAAGKVSERRFELTREKRFSEVPVINHVDSFLKPPHLGLPLSAHAPSVARHRAGGEGPAPDRRSDTGSAGPGRPCAPRWRTAAGSR